MPRATKYQQITSGEWYPLERCWDLQCCDCGLVHEVTIRIHDGKPQIRMTVQPRATAQVRRYRKRSRNG